MAEKSTLYWRHTAEGQCMSDGCIAVTGKRSWFNNYKLHSMQPSFTLSTQEQCFSHWNEPRNLTFREWKRLGSFPDDYHAKTDKIGKYMIGMSVPPRMTEAVAKAVIEQWLQPKS